MCQQPFPVRFTVVETWSQARWRLYQGFKSSVYTAYTDIIGPVHAFCVHNICASVVLQIIDSMSSSAGTVIYKASCSEWHRVEVMDDCLLEMGTSLFLWWRQRGKGCTRAGIVATHVYRYEMADTRKTERANLYIIAIMNTIYIILLYPVSLDDRMWQE